MNKELKKLLEAVKDFNWTVTQEDGNVFDFGWYSPCGQDFHNEFDFKSNINTFRIKYHAVKEKHGYKVTCEVGCEWDFSREEMHKQLLNGNYEIIR